jgi:hypothetical protein
MWMAELKELEIDSALLRKGFRKHENDHAYYLLYVDGKRTSIRTKLSHGSKTKYDDGLLSIIKRQLKMPNLQFLVEFVQCKKREEDYVTHLKEKEGILFSSEPNRPIKITEPG